MRSLLHGLTGALWLSAPAIRAQLAAGSPLSLNQHGGRHQPPSPGPDMAVSVHIAANGGRKWSCSWASRSLRPLWRCLPELHQKHSHCTACGCVISSAAAPIAPQAGTEHLSSTAHLVCAERMGESIDSPAASSTPACTQWMGWARLVRSSSHMPFCSRRNRPIEPRPIRPFSSTLAARQCAQRRMELADGCA